MNAFVRTVGSRWTLTAFGMGAALGMVWLFGPFLTVLEGWLPRVLAMLVMVFVWLTANLLIDRSRRQVEHRLASGITGSAAAGSSSTAPSAGAEDVAEQRERLTRAMTLLRQARGTRGYLYEQPWYVIIGPPGSGKTTALANSGLRFPLAAELNGGEIPGVGGTRFCDWSFTDEAVLIDTAGRYFTQDSDAAVDRTGWEGFLDLLRRTRPRQPLNGVIIAISVADLAQAPADERRAHARTIRSRIKELYTRLAARIPVYVLFTKLDLIQGFTDFFDDLDGERRAQVWGVTFPLDSGHAGPAARFPAEFEALTAQLSARVIDRLQAERSPERRTAIADFPVQFASMQASLGAFVDEAFSGTRLDPAVFLRGIYFTSGTQEGSPIDRLTGALARNFGIDQRRAAALRPSHGRGYFLETLFKRVVFGEAMLVGRNLRAARRRLLLRGTAWSVTGAAVVASFAALWLVSGAVAGREQRFNAALAAYRQSIDAARLSPVPLAASDLPQVVVPLLDRARALAQQAGEPANGGVDVGLAQHAKMVEAAETVYRRALQYLLLPRLVSALEARMRTRGGDLDALYQATRVYLILCGQGLMDRGLVRAWVLADWEQTYASASLAPLRADLAVHLDALLDQPTTEFPAADPHLVDWAQAKLANIGVADRAYALLRSAGTGASTAPAFVPADAIGPMAGDHFVRSSGRSLQDPIPGFFTAAGLQAVVLPAMCEVTEQAMRDSWVLGKPSAVDPSDVVARQAIEHDVLARYARDYRANWDSLLDDLQVVAPTDPNAAVTEFHLLTAENGPIKLLLTAMVKEFRLTPPPKPATGAPVTGASACATPANGAPAAAAATDPSIKALDAHFRNLREFVEQGLLKNMLDSVDQLRRQIADQVAANASSAAPVLSPGIDSAQALKAAAASAPPPVSRWLTTLAQGGGAVRDDAARQHAAAAYSGPGGALPMCQEMVKHFPFRPSARDDVPIRSFAELFAPNGRFDTFYGEFVRPFVDSSQQIWKLRDPAGTEAPVTADGVAAFQHAMTIAATFFGFGGTQPQVHFALRPGPLDAAANQVTLDFGGITTVWKPDVAAGMQVLDWPGPAQMTRVTATFDPPGTGPDLLQTGPWALFRFLRAAQVARAGDGESYTVTLRQGDRTAQFNLSAASAHSPFDAGLFSSFQCPALRP